MKKKNKEKNKQIDKKKTKPKQRLDWRRLVLVSAFIVVGLYIAAHLARWQIIDVELWRARASESQLQSEVLQPERGSIYDANMQELAQSSLVWKLAVDPQTIAKSELYDVGDKSEEPARFAAQMLAEILGKDENELYEKYCAKTDVAYIAFGGYIEKPQVDKIRQLEAEYGLRGLIIKESTTRRYPYGELAAAVLGFTNAESNGAAGLELWYNEMLAGTQGRSVSVRDKFNREIVLGDLGEYYAAQNGYSLQLTLDIKIQQSLEKNLAAAIEKYSVVNRGIGIVMDINTGAVLAMASYPAYNPNDPWAIYNSQLRAEIEGIQDPVQRQNALYAAQLDQWRNKAVSDTYEPGSVYKVITAAAALDSGVYSMESQFSCVADFYVADHKIGCAKNKIHGTLTMHDALVESCNVGFVQVGAGVGAESMYDYANAFGLTKPTGIDLPGEPSATELYPLMHHYPGTLGVSQLASLSFGQTVKFTPMQVMVAASAAVNGGNIVKPYLVSRLLDSEGRVVQEFAPEVLRQAISEETSALIATALEDLVISPNGQNAYVAGYRVGGKSGTSEKVDLLSIEERKAYLSSFFAFAPANKPQIAVMIILDEPTNDPMGNFFGARLAGPSVGNVISDTVKILGIEPDYTEEELARTTIATPYLLKLDLETAAVRLNQNGLSYKIVGGGTEVVAQYPESYMPIPRGGQVIIYTEEGLQQTAEMPQLEGLGASEAINTLKSLGFNVLSTGAPETSINVVVVQQAIPPGTALPLGTVVQLVLHDLSTQTD